MFLQRLVFGCGRLTGGASRRDACGLLGQVFDAGIIALDVAPSYGIGTAEQVIGEALRRSPPADRIEIITKVGLAPPRFGQLRTYLRAAKRALRPTPPRDMAGWQPLEPANAFGQCHLDPRAISASVARSARLLPHIDRLLLHGCGPAECTAEVRSAIEHHAGQLGAQPGYAVSSRFDAAMDAGYPAHFFAETAIDPAVLSGSARSSLRKDALFHSLVPTAAFLVKAEPRFAAELENVARRLSGVDQATAQITAVYALAAVREPKARFVFASADRNRLAALLAAFTQIERGNLLQELGSELR